MQPGDGLKSVTFYTEDEQAYREQVWILDTKVNDGWNLAQVKISRDYDFMVFVEVIRAGGEVGQIAIGQAHNMFSRIFRIQKYEFFLPYIILCTISFSSSNNQFYESLISISRI